MMPWSLLLGVPLAPVVADIGSPTDMAARWSPVLVTLLVNVALVSVWAGRIGERVQSMQNEHRQMYGVLAAGIAEIKASLYTRHEAEALDKRVTRLEDA